MGGGVAQGSGGVTAARFKPSVVSRLFLENKKKEYTVCPRSFDQL